MLGDAFSVHRFSFVDHHCETAVRLCKQFRRIRLAPSSLSLYIYTIPDRWISNRNLDPFLFFVFSLDPCFFETIERYRENHPYISPWDIRSKFGFEEDVGIPSKGSERRRLLIERTSALSVAAVLNSRWNGFSSAGSFSIKLHLFLSLRNAPDASLISSYWRARTPTVRILDPDRTVSSTV